MRKQPSELTFPLWTIFLPLPASGFGLLTELQILGQSTPACNPDGRKASHDAFLQPPRRGRKHLRATSLLNPFLCCCKQLSSTHSDRVHGKQKVQLYQYRICLTFQKHHQTHTTVKPFWVYWPNCFVLFMCCKGCWVSMSKWNEKRTGQQGKCVPFEAIIHITVHIYLAQFSISPN